MTARGGSGTVGGPAPGGDRPGARMTPTWPQGWRGRGNTMPLSVRAAGTTGRPRAARGGMVLDLSDLARNQRGRRGRAGPTSKRGTGGRLSSQRPPPRRHAVVVRSAPSGGWPHPWRRYGLLLGSARSRLRQLIGARSAGRWALRPPVRIRPGLLWALRGGGGKLGVATRRATRYTPVLRSCRTADLPCPRR